MLICLVLSDYSSVDRKELRDVKGIAQGGGPVIVVWFVTSVDSVDLINLDRQTGRQIRVEPVHWLYIPVCVYKSVYVV